MTTLSDSLLQLMITLQLEDAPVGGSVVVYHRGNIVGQASIGHATPDNLWASNTLSLNFSTGKSILVTLVHILVSQGRLDYDTPIADYWPQFAANGKRDITLQSVLTHRAGLFNVQAVTTHTADVLDWATMLHRVEMMPAEMPNNSRAESCYSALVSGWVLGGLIEKVTGLSLNSALNHYLAKPLGVEDEMYFGVPADNVRNVATLAKNFANFDTVERHDALSNPKPTSNPKPKPQRYKPLFRADTKAVLQAYQTLPSYRCWQQLRQNQAVNTQAVQIQAVQTHENSKTAALTPALTTLEIVRLYVALNDVNVQDFKHSLMPTGLQPLDYYAPATLMASIPAANGVATAQALATMGAMLAAKGVWQGKTIINLDVFAKLSTIYVTGSDAVMPATHPNSMQWRLGYHRLFSRCQGLSHETAFGHMGYNGSTTWWDTHQELAVAFVHNYETTMSTDIRQFAITEAILKWYDDGMV